MMNKSDFTIADKFNNKQLSKMTELLYSPKPKTQKEKDIWNLKFARYSIRFGSFNYRIGMIKTLDRAIKRLEEDKKEN